MANSNAASTGRIVEFLIALSEDPNKTQEFKRDPQAYMQGAGLSKEDQDMVLAGRQAVMQKLSVQTAAETTHNVVVIIVVVVVA